MSFYVSQISCIQTIWS